MTNDLALLATEDSPLAMFQPGNKMILKTMQENVGDDDIALHELAQAKTPSGAGKSFQIDGGNVDEMKEIVGIPLGWLPEGQLWGSEDVGGETGQPVLVTHDLKFAYMLNPDIGDLDPAKLEAALVPDTPGETNWYDWTKLPYCDFGTNKRGSGKRAKEKKLVPILCAESHLPMVVHVPAGSLKGCDRFRRTAMNVPYYYQMIRLSLTTVPKKGDIPAYAQVQFEVVPGQLTEEQAEMLKGMFVEPLKEQHTTRTLAM